MSAYSYSFSASAGLLKKGQKLLRTKVDNSKSCFTEPICSR